MRHLNKNWWFERWVDSSLNASDWLFKKSIDMSVIGYIAQRMHTHAEIETNLQSTNHNALDSLPNLQWNIIITALTEGAIDLVWGCLAPP